MSPNSRIESEHCFYSWAKITFKEFFFFPLNSIINYLSYPTHINANIFMCVNVLLVKKIPTVGEKFSLVNQWDKPHTRDSSNHHDSLFDWLPENNKITFIY